MPHRFSSRRTLPGAAAAWRRRRMALPRSRPWSARPVRQLNTRSRVPRSIQAIAGRSLGKR
eukprot:scaffold71054_cov18-Phaeocystis_antarctica.AAC.1